ncbi:MAG: S41 family peptidase [Fimbriimonadaceae bacterium]
MRRLEVLVLNFGDIVANFGAESSLWFFMMRRSRLFLCALMLASLVLPVVASAQFKTGEELVKKDVEFTAEIREQILTGLTDILETRAFVPGLDFKKWDDLLAKNRDELLKIETENGFTAGVNRLLRDFGITHIGLQSPRSANFRRTGVTSGLGVGAQFADGALVVRSVADGSPAAKAGLKIGDKIVTIDGVAVTESSRLAPNGDAELKLTFIRGNEAVREVSVKSGEYQVNRADTLTWIGDDIAVLRINSFSRGYDRQAIDKMMTEAAKAKGVIVDLRNNGGGAVSNLAHLMGLFIDSNEPVGTFVNRQMMRAFLDEKKVETGDVKEIAAWGQNRYRPQLPTIPRYEGKVAVLINRGSASASEIFSAAMRDVRGAVIVGQTSRGAVLASTYGRLAGGFEIQYPVSDYVTIKGQRLEGDPVVPTLPVQNGNEPGDQVLDAAVNALRTGPVLAKILSSQ